MPCAKNSIAHCIAGIRSVIFMTALRQVVNLSLAPPLIYVRPAPPATTRATGSELGHTLGGRFRSVPFNTSPWQHQAAAYRALPTELADRILTPVIFDGKMLVTPRAGAAATAVAPTEGRDKGGIETEGVKIGGPTVAIESVIVTDEMIGEYLFEQPLAHLDLRHHARTRLLNETHSRQLRQHQHRSGTLELVGDLPDHLVLNTFFSLLELNSKLRMSWMFILRFLTMAPQLLAALPTLAQIARATAQLTAAANSLIAQQQQAFNAQVHEFLAVSKQNAAHPELRDKSTHELHSRSDMVEADQTADLRENPREISLIVSTGMAGPLGA
ncbi:unnamed protein product [Prorocentrum cordatum]|uniref:Uncharacterized protein n=1 Tax=Prorocentrum cordatum TaxID=2364126 RepID=A0ABN9S212_9DINO|nr:unnamed protein product [Polarella glacialis]